MKIVLVLALMFGCGVEGRNDGREEILPDAGSVAIDGGGTAVTDSGAVSMVSTATVTCSNGYAIHLYPGKTASDLLQLTAWRVGAASQLGGRTVTRSLAGSALFVGDGHAVVVCETFTSAVFVLPS